MVFMNRKGQALVEFILILPVFLIILFTILDFGNIFYSKNKLENVSTDIVLMMKNGEGLEKIEEQYKGISITKNTYGEDYYRVRFEQEIVLMNPFLYRILGNPFVIEVERVIPNDE